MKETKEKGITMVALIITVIILALLAGVAIYTGGNMINHAKLQTIHTNMLLIQAKGKTKQEEASFKKDDSILVGQKLADFSEKIQIQNKVGITAGEEQYNKWYVLDQTALNNLGLDSIVLKGKDYYLINYETEEIANYKGYQHVDGKQYYKLSDIQNLSFAK